LGFNYYLRCIRDSRQFFHIFEHQEFGRFHRFNNRNIVSVFRGALQLHFVPLHPQYLFLHRGHFGFPRFVHHHQVCFLIFGAGLAAP